MTYMYNIKRGVVNKYIIIYTTTSNSKLTMMVYLSMIQDRSSHALPQEFFKGGAQKRPQKENKDTQLEVKKPPKKTGPPHGEKGPHKEKKGPS